MKKALVRLFSAIFLLLPIIVLAQPAGMVPTNPQAVWDTINTITNWAFAILLAVAALVIIFAAYLFLTAAGDPDKVSKARNYILYALIAVVVAFLAKAIVGLVARMLGVDVGGVIF